MVSGGVGGERVTTKIEFSLQFVAYSLLLQIEWERKNLPICSQLCEAGFGSCTKAILQRRINLLKGKNKPPEAGNFLLVSCITTPPQTAVLPELQQWGVRGCPHITCVCVTSKIGWHNIHCVCNGDPILSEMGTKWGPLAAEMGTQKAYIWRIDLKRENSLKKIYFFLNIYRDKVCHNLVQSVCALYIA